MANNPLKKFYQLIEDEQYRDALGVLETEDIPPSVAEKWHQWLNDLHKEDRLIAGVASDKEVQDYNRLYYEQMKAIGSVIGLSLFSLLFPILMVVLLSTSVAPFIILFAIFTSYYGLRWTIALFFHQNINEYTFIALGGLGIITMTIIPIYNYYEQSTYALLLALLWFLPFSAHIGWHLGERIGLKIAKHRRPEFDAKSKDGEEKQIGATT